MIINDDNILRIEEKIKKYSKKESVKEREDMHLKDNDLELYADYLMLEDADEYNFTSDESKRILEISDHISMCEECDKKINEEIGWRDTVVQAAVELSVELSKANKAKVVLQKKTSDILSSALSELQIIVKDGVAYLLNKAQALLEMNSNGLIPTAALAGARGGNGRYNKTERREFISGSFDEGIFRLEIEDIIRPDEKDKYLVKIILGDDIEKLGRAEINGQKVVYFFDDVNFEENTKYEVRVEINNGI